MCVCVCVSVCVCVCVCVCLVPEDFFDVLSSFTQKGMRVLAIGHRTVDLAWHKTEKIERFVCTCDLLGGGAYTCDLLGGGACTCDLLGGGACTCDLLGEGPVHVT